VAALAGRTEASSEQPRGRREPHGAAGVQRNAYLVIAEALQDGADVVAASDEVGRRLAEVGVSLLEALDGLGALYRSIAGGEPAFAAVRALSSSWAESSLIYLHSLSCEDPLTGLGGDVLGRVGPRRAAALVGREPNLPDEVETVRSLITQWRLDSEEPQLVRVWIEGLPVSVEWAGRVLDELAR
jgi:hypothetical protein